MARAFKVRQVKVTGGKELRYAARLEAVERDLVVGLMNQVADLIDVPETPAPAEGGRGAEQDAFDDIVARLGMPSDSESESGSSAAAGSRGQRPSHVAGHEDPAIRRLFPIANRTDDEAAAEFARLSESGLRQRKRDNLLAAAELFRHGDKIELTAASAQTVLVALTDVRVVLGERMSLRTDEDAAALDLIAAGLAEDDPRLQLILIYDFLTWLQESLAVVLLSGLD